MQPHSMCALTLCKLVWEPQSSKFTRTPKRCEMYVEFKKRGKFEKKYYQLTDIVISEDNRELEVRVRRQEGGIDCVVTARRRSTEEGSEIVMTHSQQHIADLREEFKLWKNKIADGRHVNSKQYRYFAGYANHPEDEELELTCECNFSGSVYAEIPYKLVIESVE